MGFHYNNIGKQTDFHRLLLANWRYREASLLMLPFPILLCFSCGGGVAAVASSTTLTLPSHVPIKNSRHAYFRRYNLISHKG